MRARSQPYLLASPWILTLLLFWLFPLVWSLYLSFTNYGILNPQSDWIGLANYQKLFRDPAFWIALKNTFIFVIGTVPVTTVLALAFALALNQKLPWRGLFRAGFFIPSITSLVVVALVFTNLYSQNGYLTLLAKAAGIETRGLLLSEKTALPAIMLMDVWAAVGYYLLLFLAALQAIPQELYEQADISGASRWQKFRHVTLPHLRPMFLFVVVINAIKSFQVFTEIFVMTKGGPLSATTTSVYQVYEEGLQRFQMGYASALAYLLFLIIAGFSFLAARLFRLGKGIAD